MNEDGSYNGSRNIFFDGEPTGKGMYSDGSGLDCSRFVGSKFVEECDCKPSALTRAPEDEFVRRES